MDIYIYIYIYVYIYIYMYIYINDKVSKPENIWVSFHGGCFFLYIALLHSISIWLSSLKKEVYSVLKYNSYIPFTPSVYFSILTDHLDLEALDFVE